MIELFQFNYWILWWINVNLVGLFILEIVSIHKLVYGDTKMGHAMTVKNALNLWRYYAIANTIHQMKAL